MRRSKTCRAGDTRVVPGVLVVLLVLLGAMTGCEGGESQPPALRLVSQSYTYVIRSDLSPPHAREPIHYSVQILDRKTRQPIENGTGQLFAGKPVDEDVPSGPQSKTWDGMTYGPEIGTYHAKLNFVVAGLWAVAIRFQRDSLHPLERIDWYQDVLDERPSNTP